MCVCTYSLPESLCYLNCCKDFQDTNEKRWLLQVLFSIYNTLFFVYDFLSCFDLNHIWIIDHDWLEKLKRKFQFSLPAQYFIFKSHEKGVLIFMFVDHVFIVTNDVRLKGINLVKLVLVQSIQLTTYNIIYRVKTMPW